ncbi:MAG: Hsp20/alpha crystallin family protein [Pseudanabaenaceae cyanobacterium bins.68]|nr:Hsp20/alpha crystallin family protein [Pseudanabaenaceae cyanobacterium bins.68]
MIIRWQPFQEVETMRNQIDRVFQNMSALTEEAAKSEWYPATELYEQGDHLVLRVIAPGVSSESLDIQVTKDTVAISGDRNASQDQERRYFWSEIRYGKFHRLINLPIPVQNEDVQAEYLDGVLSLTLPKATEVKAFKVSVNKINPAA